MVSPHRSLNKQLDQTNQHATGCRQYQPLYQEASIRAQRGNVFSSLISDTQLRKELSRYNSGELPLFDISGATLIRLK